MKTQAKTMHEVSVEWDIYVTLHNEKKNQRYNPRPYATHNSPPTQLPQHEQAANQ